jgi:flavodoxin short chain
MSKAAVIYWSGTGNTEKMADAVLSGLRAAGAEAELFFVDKIAPAEAAGYEKLAFGCPSMGDEVLEESEFEPFFAALEENIAGKPIALFGSYGWGDGAWMRSWKERCEDKGAKPVTEGLIVNETPDDAALADCNDLGKKLAEA